MNSAASGFTVSAFVSVNYLMDVHIPTRVSHLTALFTKPLATFMAYGSFRNSTRQNHGMAGNLEAGGFVNSAVKQPLPINLNCDNS